MIDKSLRKILYLLPTRDWSTKERLALRDMLLTKSHGHKVFLSTCEDSYLAKLAKANEIQVIPFKEHFFNRFAIFHKHFPLSQVSKISKIDIIHCYDFDLLLSLSLQLKAENTTALILTQNHIVDKPLHHFWFRPLIARIDSLLLVNKNLKQDAVGNLGLALKKIEFLGMGLKIEDLPMPENIAINFEQYNDYFLAGTIVPPGIVDLEALTPLFSALKVLNEKSPGGIKSKLALISPVEFQTISILPQMMKQIEELEIQEDILFIKTGDTTKAIQYLDVWISKTGNELIEDFAICALMQEVPVILPRNFCSKDILKEFEGIGETYKLFDARELRDKWEKIILGHPVYKEKTRLYKYFFEKEHSYKLYKTKLLGLYSRSVQKRERLFRKK